MCRIGGMKGRGRSGADGIAGRDETVKFKTSVDFTS